MHPIRALVISFLLLVASCPAASASFHGAIGSGIQFGGVLGVQGALVAGSNKFRLSFGYTGMNIGYERLIDANWSLGLQGFVNQYRVGSGFNLNYYFGSHATSSWFVGFDLYRGYNSGELGSELIIDFFEYVFDSDAIDLDAELENGAFLSLGYRF